MLIKIKVQTNCKREEIIKKKEDSFLVKVKEKPIEGRANERVLFLISEFLDIPTGKIHIYRGTKTPHKILEIKN
jgi:hypothetical protein